MLRRPTVALVSALLFPAALAASSGAATAGPASGAKVLPTNRPNPGLTLCPGV